MPLQTQPLFSSSCALLPGPNQPVKALDLSNRKPPIVLTEATPITLETEPNLPDFHYEILDVHYYMHNGKKKKKVKKKKVRSSFDSTQRSQRPEDD